MLKLERIYGGVHGTLVKITSFPFSELTLWHINK